MNSKIPNIYPWVVVGLLWGVALLNYMDRQMLSTMRIPMMADVRDGGLPVDIRTDESHFRDYR